MRWPSPASGGVGGLHPRWIVPFFVAVELGGLWPMSNPGPSRGSARPSGLYCGPYFRPVLDVIPPSNPRGATFTKPMSAL